MNAPESIFLAARERPPKERTQFLDHACAGNPTLRARVEAMLIRHAEAAAFFGDETRKGSDNDLLRLRPEEMAGIGEREGSTIGRYKLLQRIGEGGMGVVYMAEQEEPVRRRVALKIIKLGMDTRQVVARFEAERQALAMMDHPNIAKVLDAGATDSGRPYFVMELVAGVPITEFCDRNRLSLRDRINLFLPVCRAIQSAHQKGVIHRDIKPSNVIVTLHHGDPMPKVIDFGVAKATSIKLTEKTVFTQFGTMIGTPAYMSPEQAEMTSLDVDTRSDVYSLGVLLYELLTGSTPFPAERLRSLGFGQIQRVIAEEEPPKPSTRLSTLEGSEKTSVAQNRGLPRERLGGDLRSDLDWIVMKCLEKDRRRRYDTVNGLAMDLVRHLTNEPVLARPPSATYRFQKAYRRNRLAFSAAGAVGAALLLGVVASTLLAVRARHAEAQAIQEATRATQAEQLARERLAALTVERDAKEIARRRAEAISNFLRSVFQSPDPARSGRTITVAETLDRTTRDLDSKLKDQPGQRALLQATLASTYQSLGLYREALPLCESVCQHERAKSGPPGADYLNAISELAGAYDNLERHAEALRLREEARNLSRRLFGAESESAAACLLNLGGTLLSLKRFEEARPILDESLLISRRILGSNHPGTLMALHNLASCLHELGEPERALVMREEVFEHHRQNFGPKHPATLTAMNNLAASCGAAGRHAESLRLHQEVYQLSHDVHGPDHPSTLMYLQNLLFTFQEFEENLPATPDRIALFEESVRLTQKVKGPDHPDTIRAWENLVSIQTNSGNDQRAAEARAELQKHQTRTFEAQPQDMAYALRHSALLAWFGNEAESLKARAQILRVASEFTNPQDLDRAAKAASLWPQSDSASQAAALRLARRAVELGAKHPYLIYFQFALGLAEYRSGLFADAESTWRQVAPVSTAPEILLNTTTFYRAMTLFQLGRKEEAQAAFDAAVSVMTPLPKDTQYPLTGGNSADNLVNWMAYREARALLTDTTASPDPGSLARGQ